MTFGPEKTLTEIRDAVRTAVRPVEVVLRDGVYHVGRPLELTVEDSGTAEAPVVCRAEHPGKVILTAATSLEWRHGEQGFKVAEIPGREPLPGFLNGAVMRGFENYVQTPCFLVQDGEPRALAMSEVLWCGPRKRAYPEFKREADAVVRKLRQGGFNAAE